MDELRWALLIVGALLIAGVYAYGCLQDWRRDGVPWKRRREPFADDAESETPGEDPLLDDGEDDGVMGPARVISTAEETGSVASVRARRVSPDHEPQSALEDDPQGPGVDIPPEDGEEKIVVLTVMAPRGSRFSIGDVIRVLENAGLRLTEGGFLRRGLDTGRRKVTLFTAANIVEPGTFDVDSQDTATTPGIALIMQLPGPFDGPATFEQMLTIARRTAEQLGGMVLDGRRCDLTHQAIEHIREELLEYRRRAHLASRRGA